jgi:hypothetical protein
VDEMANGFARGEEKFCMYCELSANEGCSYTPRVYTMSCKPQLEMDAVQIYGPNTHMTADMCSS